MDTFWRILYIFLVGGIIWLLHSRVGSYPAPLPASDRPSREIIQTLGFWLLALGMSIMMVLVLPVWLDPDQDNRTVFELIRLPFLTVIYLVIPLVIMFRVNHWEIRDLGFRWNVESLDVAIFALVFGIISGSTAYFTRQANIGIDILPWGALILLLFNNAFLEEFYYRGVIQNLLERATGQAIAIIVGGILFGLTHVLFDVSVLFQTQGLLAVVLSVALQIMAGWVFGIIYMKTRSLWPGITCHYMANWLPSILTSIFG